MMKRLFFANAVHAPWPETLPPGRIVEPSSRHLTLAFLGSTDEEMLLKKLEAFRCPEFKIGIVGKFDRPLFLSHVVAWHIAWLENPAILYQLIPNSGDFLPHVTIARAPFVINDWKNSFSKLPVFVGSLHLFESLGYSQYRSLWSFPVLPPFEEIAHTADLAFKIYGETFDQLFWHGLTALAFKFTQLIDYQYDMNNFLSLSDVIASLNKWIAKVDSAIGCPFKAVSYHGKIKEHGGSILEWEMIVDV